MKIMKKVLHSRRPLVMKHTEVILAKNFEKVMKLKRGACKVTLTEHPELKACPTDQFPHVHCDVLIECDDTQKLKTKKAPASEPHCLRCGMRRKDHKKDPSECFVYGKPYGRHMWKAPKSEKKVLTGGK